MHNLGFLYVEKGEFELAEDVLERSVEVRTEMTEGGADDPLTMSSVCLLSAVYVELGDTEKARPILYRTLKYQLATLGEWHLETCTTTNYLGVILLESGNAEDEPEAEEMLLRVIAVRSQAPSLGPDSMSVIATEDQVAQLYWRQGRKEEAAPAVGGSAI